MGRHVTTRFRILGLATALGTTSLLALGAALSAQSVDSRWLPWVGCWEPVGAQDGSDLLCVLPSDEAGAVEVLRLSGTDVESREVVWADGERHQTEREKCTGWEEGRFSSDGRRVFMRSEHTCEGGAVQDGAGIMTMATPNEWLDIRVMGLEDERMAFVQRYHPASVETTTAAGFADVLGETEWSVRSARMLAAVPLEVDDVIEASALVPEDAVKALLAERGDPLDLSADRLVRMAEAGVSEDVIDVAVAVSYPRHFSVAAGGAEMEEVRDERRAYRPIFMGSWYDPFYSPWSLRYGYGLSYRYGAFGYGYPYYGFGYGGYGYGGYRPAVVVVDRAPRDHGRVINGRGYRLGRSGATSGGTGYRGSARPRGSTGVSSSGGSTGSGGSARGSSGRTAKRRGGGL